jgi:phosphoribosylaminoimidazolecarboxamide formyltransferase/IMP cyclohydrolase
MKISRALLSVYDKTGIVEFARKLTELGVAILSTGGTATALQQAGVPHLRVDEVTSFPEILGGRVKTLHPAIHAGILFRRNLEEDSRKLAELGIKPIDLVAVNLYPFARTAADPHAEEETVIEMIDIGGPAMLRSAAKNHRWVLPVCKPARYDDVIRALEAGEVTDAFRRELAAEAFDHTSRYDRAVAAYLSAGNAAGGPEAFPEDLILHFHQFQPLRYGENPHQKAAFYLLGHETAAFQQLGGKELSYNNFLDLDAAAGLAHEFQEPCLALLKHTVPCGVATGEDLVDCYRRAFATDQSSPFGGIVGVNRPVTAALAAELAEVFYEVIVAPDFEEEALEILRRKKNLRLVKLWKAPSEGRELRSAFGGLLVQDRDRISPDTVAWRVVTKRPPTETELRALEFAWKVARWAKSNAVVFTDGEAGNAHRTLGIGLGQTSRVDAVELAVARSKKYGTDLRGSVAASDAFFPFADGAEAVLAAGATAIIQPGGSVRDAEVIAACDRRGAAMVFTGERHFRH